MQLWLLLEHRVYIYGDTWDSDETVFNGLKHVTSKDISIQVSPLGSSSKELLSLITRHSLNFSEEADRHPFARTLQLVWDELTDHYPILITDQQHDASAREADVMQLWNNGVPFYVVTRDFPLEGDW